MFNHVSDTLFYVYTDIVAVCYSPLRFFLLPPSHSFTIWAWWIL